MYILPLSAKTDEALEDQARALAHALRGTGLRDKHLADVTYTLVVGRQHFQHRVAVICEAHTDAAQLLEAFAAKQSDDRTVSGVVPANFSPDQRLELDNMTLNLNVADETILVEAARRYVEGYGLPTTRPPRPATGRRLHLPTYRFTTQTYDKRALNNAAGEATAPRLARERITTVAEAWETGRDKVPVIDEEPNAYRHFYGCRWSDATDDLSEVLVRPERVLVVDQWGPSDLARRLLARHRLDGAYCDHLRLSDFAASVNDDVPRALGMWLDALPEPSKLIDLVYILDMPSNEKDDAGSKSDLDLLDLSEALEAYSKLTAKSDWFIISADAFEMSGLARESSLSGLGYWLAQKHPARRVRNLDVSQRELAKSDEAGRLIDLILMTPPSARGNLTRIEAGRRARMVFPRLRGPDGGNSTISRGAAYVIAGGSGVLGRVLTTHLIGRHDARVTWIGRSEPDSPLIAAAIKAYGTRLTYIRADLTDAGQTRQAIARAGRRHGRLAGAVFAASQLETLAEGVETIQAARMSAQIKQVGARNFYQALESEGLDFLCYFSSIQSFSYTLAAQTPGYALGCSWADAFVRSLSRAPFFVSTINWGYWERSVRGTPWEARLQGRFGLLSDEEGVEAFEAFLRLGSLHGVHQAIIMKSEGPMQELIGADRAGELRFRPARGPSQLEALWTVAAMSRAECAPAS